MIEAMQNLMSNTKPEEAARKPPSLIHPPTSKRSKDTSKLPQSTYETRHLTIETQAKRQTGKVPKTPTTTRMAIPEETIDYAPEEETIDYEMNGIPHSYGAFPEFRDDPDDDDPLL